MNSTSKIIPTKMLLDRSSDSFVFSSKLTLKTNDFRGQIYVINFYAMEMHPLCSSHHNCYRGIHKELSIHWENARYVHSTISYLIIYRSIYCETGQTSKEYLRLNWLLAFLSEKAFVCALEKLILMFAWKNKERMSKRCSVWADPTQYKQLQKIKKKISQKPI